VQSQDSLSSGYTPIIGPLTMSPLPLDIMALAQESDSTEVCARRGSDQPVIDVQPTTMDYEHAMSLLGQDKWENIARWVVSTELPDFMWTSPDDNADRNSSSVFLDHLERGVELGQDAPSEVMTAATIGYKPPMTTIWSLPGIQGSLLPRNLSAQTRIWGV
jgi:hypothetical protein